MSSSLMPSYLDPDIFVNHISSRLYREHLENLYWTCRSMHSELDKSGEYIYKEICLHHKPHSIDDLPAEIYKNGHHFWYKEGKRHRDGDLPASIFVSVRANVHSIVGMEWYNEGELHRDCDLPSRISVFMDPAWYIEGIRYKYPPLYTNLDKSGKNILYKREWVPFYGRRRDGEMTENLIEMVTDKCIIGHGGCNRCNEAGCGTSALEETLPAVIDVPAIIGLVRPDAVVQI
jgi:hypothetical protein